MEKKPTASDCSGLLDRRCGTLPPLPRYPRSRTTLPRRVGTHVYDVDDYHAVIVLIDLVPSRPILVGAPLWSTRVFGLYSISPFLVDISNTDCHSLVVVVSHTTNERPVLCSLGLVIPTIR